MTLPTVAGATDMTGLISVARIMLLAILRLKFVVHLAMTSYSVDVTCIIHCTGLSTPDVYLYELKNMCRVCIVTWYTYTESAEFTLRFLDTPFA